MHVRVEANSLVEVKLMNTSQSILIENRQPVKVISLLMQVASICKIRIGVTIAFTALAGIAITPGQHLSGWQILAIGLAVFLSSASAGGFNQYLERDLDARMARTQSRLFVTGELQPGRAWLFLLYGMLLSSIMLAVLATNIMAGLYVFLGAFFYVVVYTVWLKRRSWLNIVLGGLAGSFAVMAGAAAVNPELGALPVLFAVILFLWTPPHFWSLAIAMHDDYAAAGVPMLPVVIGNRAAARVIVFSTVLLVAASLLPYFYGLGWLYLFGALAGGLYFIKQTIHLLANPSRKSAMTSFHASLAQLTILLIVAIVDAQFVSMI